MEKRENGEHTMMKEIFKRMSPLSCACGALRPHSLLSHQGPSTTIGVSLYLP